MGNKSSSGQSLTDTVPGSLWLFVRAGKNMIVLINFILEDSCHNCSGLFFFFPPLAVFALVSLAHSRSREMPQTAVIGAHRGWGVRGVATAANNCNYQK